VIDPINGTIGRARAALSSTRSVRRLVILAAALAFATGTATPAASPVAGAAAPAASVVTAPGPVIAALGARPKTQDRPVPSSIRPAVRSAARDFPKPYFDGCHVEQDGGLPDEIGCTYGRIDGSRTIVLFGDSHALSWFPAVEKMAIRKGWRLLSLTMSACTPADIPAYAPKTRTVSEPCAEWRDATLGLIELIRPAIVLAAGTRGFATVDASGAVLTGADRTAAWEGGIERTIDRLKSSGARVIWIADTPIARVDPPACLARHMRSTLACATPVSYAVNAAWLSEEHLVTQVESVGFIDPSLWVCPSSPCPAVIGNLLVYRDAGHMTATFMASLSARLEKAVAADLAAHP
jgi:hypothetical protein